MPSRLGRWNTILAVMLAAGSAACAGTGPPSTADPGTDWLQVKAHSVLARWTKAVDAAGGQGAFIPVGGSTAQVGDWEVDVGSNNKPAVMAGLVQAVVDLPPQKPPDGQVRWPDGTTLTVRLMSAKEAVSGWTPEGGADCPGCQPVRITGARLTTGQVETSRGPATAPLWEFTVKGSAVRLTRIAVAAAMTVELPPLEPVGVPFTLSIDSAGGTVAGLDLTVRFVGARDSADKPCGVDYGAEAVESATAIVVILSSRSNPTPGGCTLEGYERTALVKLAAPLGGRAVLNLQNGEPVSVSLTR